MTWPTWNFTARYPDSAMRVGQQEAVVNEEGNVVGTAPTTPPRYTFRYTSNADPFMIGIESSRGIIGTVQSFDCDGPVSINFRHSGNDYVPRYPRRITRQVVSTSTSVNPNLDPATWGRIGSGEVIARTDFTPPIAMGAGDHLHVAWTFQLGRADVEDPSILIRPPAARGHSRLLGIEVVEDHSVPQGTFWVVQEPDRIRVRAESMGSLLTAAPRPVPRVYTWHEPVREPQWGQPWGQPQAGEAQKRARDLLLSHLDKDQRKMFAECGYFEVYVSKEKKYRICNTRTANVEMWQYYRASPHASPKNNTSFIPPASAEYLYGRMMRSSEPTKKEEKKQWHRGRRYCAVSDYSAPICDQLLAQKLLLETNEQGFLGVAL